MAPQAKSQSSAQSKFDPVTFGEALVKSIEQRGERILNH